MTNNALLNTICDNFDFEIIRTSMTATGCSWNEYGVPTVEQMKHIVADLLRVLVNDTTLQVTSRSCFELSRVTPEPNDTFEEGFELKFVLSATMIAIKYEVYY